MFQRALACSVDPQGNAYVIDAGAGKLLKLSKDWEVLETVGGYGWTDQEFDHPADVLAPNGLDVYVADYGNHRIQRFDRNLNFISSFSTREDPDAAVRFGYPRGVAQSRFGSIFIADGENRRILKVNTSGEVELTFGDIGAGEGRLATPSRIRIGDDDHVYVQDGNRIVVFDIFGNYIGTRGEGMFRHLRSFTVFEGKVVSLDSCAIYSFDQGGAPEAVPLLDSQLAGPDLCEAVDIDMREDRLYLLAQHRLTVVRFDVDRLREEEQQK